MLLKCIFVSDGTINTQIYFESGRVGSNSNIMVTACLRNMLTRNSFSEP
jgi:hypothetical protein